MNKTPKSEVEAITDMIERGVKAQTKFAEGTAQFTLQKNRIKALQIALWLISPKEDNSKIPFTWEELEAAKAPLLSLLSKSEKAQPKLKVGSWQHTMLAGNIAALQVAVPLLEEAILKTDEKHWML